MDSTDTVDNVDAKDTVNNRVTLQHISRVIEDIVDTEHLRHCQCIPQLASYVNAVILQIWFCKYL